MKTFLQKLKKETRLVVQALFALVTNGNLAGFVRGGIYQGPLKALCLPGLNCYSCPGALGACPMGALQAVLNSGSSDFSFYVAGFLLSVGIVAGRFVCGWLCPFGLVQDLLHRIPSPKLRRLRGERWLRYLRYAVLAVLVLALPTFVKGAGGMGTPWYCQWLCPSGTLMGSLPLLAANPPLRAAVGALFWWKLGLLAAILALSVFIFRPFCRWLCPLGAVYGLFNPLSLLRLRVNSEACIRCGKCQTSCGLDIPVYEKPNHPDCIRCGQCIKSCPTEAIGWRFMK